MEPHGKGARGAMKAGLLAAGLLLGFGSATAWAQSGVAQGVLYETLESPPAHAATMGPLPGVYNAGTGERMAEAKETGDIQGWGSLAGFSGEMVVQGQSRVPFDPTTGQFGSGTVSGVFHIDNATGPGIAGKLDGSLNLSLLTSTENGCPCPLAPTSGTWSTLGKDKTSGVFQGVFLLPFQHPLAPELGWLYLELDPATGQPTGGVTPVQPSEFKDGVPLVKLVVALIAP